MGNGQSDGPTVSVAVVLVESRWRRCFCLASAAKAVAVRRSWTVSSLSTRSAPPPPRIAFKAGTSNLSAAARRAADALSGLANRRGGVVSSGAVVVSTVAAAEAAGLESPQARSRPATPAARPTCQRNRVELIDGALPLLPLS